MPVASLSVSEFRQVQEMTTRTFTTCPVRLHSPIIRVSLARKSTRKSNNVPISRGGCDARQSLHEAERQGSRCNLVALQSDTSSANRCGMYHQRDLPNMSHLYDRPDMTASNTGNRYNNNIRLAQSLAGPASTATSMTRNPFKLVTARVRLLWGSGLWTVLLTFVALGFAFMTLKLALWTASKDFLEHCLTSAKIDWKIKDQNRSRYCRTKDKHT